MKIEDGSSQIEAVRELFVEYADALGIDLSFQDFDSELASLPGVYSPPDGRLLVAASSEGTVGCVALRKIDESTCEMKRLYVRPAFRRTGLGRMLAEALIDESRRLGYLAMRLDTLGSMTEAKSLYLSLGFREIPAYRFNPFEDATFMELLLSPGDSRKT